MSAPELLIVGIDGATFDLMDDWIQAGELPHLEACMKRGVHGDLTTTYPPLTAPAWASFMTGSNPGRHGVYDFLTSDVENDGVVDFTSIRLPTVWQLLADDNRRVGTVNVPVTFPPPDVHGDIVCGPLSSSRPEEAAVPEGLIGELEEATGREWWHRDSSGQTPSQPLRYLEAHRENNRTIGAYARHLLDTRDYEAFMVHFDLVDSISHFFWHYMDPSHPHHEDRGGDYREAILSAYRFVDEQLGQLLEYRDDETDLMIMSDHGFGPIHSMVNLNNFLMDRGYLSLQKSFSTRLKRWARRIGLYPERVVRLAETFGLDFLAFALPKSLRNRIVESMGGFQDVDWGETTAFSRGHMGQVHLTKDVKRDPDRYRRLRTELAEDLRDHLRHPGTGDRLVSDIKFREEIYEGPFLERAPDLFLVMDDFQCIAYPLFSGGPDLLIPHIQEGRYANHRMNGIFIGEGPSFVSGSTLSDASIMDVAPTMLYLRGDAVPEFMDGEVLSGTLRQELLEEHPPRRTRVDTPSTPSAPSGREDEEVRERLEGLGYLGS